MRHLILPILLALVPCIGSLAEERGRKTKEEPAAVPAGNGVPASLARYYPPKDRKRTYTLQMLELGRLFGSLSMDIRALDSGKPAADLGKEVERFEEQYRKVAEMVPEWSGYFVPAEVERLKREVATFQGRSTLEPIVKAISDTCTQCHVMEMFKVQAIHHWPRFADVTAGSPTGEEVPFHETMVALASRLGALPTAVRRGDFIEAKAHQREISVQFALLEESCGNCHASPRSYFVDERVKAEILRLGAMVRKKEADEKAYIDIWSSINDRSCIPCHQVHMPAAYLQMKLEKAP